MIQNDVKKYCLEKGLTQQQLADFVDVRRETIVRLEKQLYNPSLEMAIRISDILGKEIRDLFKIVQEN